MASTSMSTTGRSTATSSGCARSSRSSTANSPRSRRSMASDIATATARTATAPDAPSAGAVPDAPSAGAAPDALPVGAAPGDPTGSHPAAGTGRGLVPPWTDAAPPQPRRRISPLTLRILAVNVLALAMLGIGLLYLGEYESSLIETELQALKTQGEIFAAALGECAVIDSVAEGEELIPELGRQMMRRLAEPTRTRARLFDAAGNLVADSRVLRGPGGIVQIRELPSLQPRGLF